MTDRQAMQKMSNAADVETEASGDVDDRLKAESGGHDRVAAMCSTST